MKTCINLLFMFFAVLTIFSCRGDDGENGADGSTGADGNANVIYSDWFTADSYTSTMLYGIRNFTYQKNAPEITQAVLDQGVVLVYGNLVGYHSSIWPVGQVAQLPISFTYIQGVQNLEDIWSSAQAVGKVTIRFVNNENYYINPSLTNKFRYIVIPANVAGKNAVDYSKMSYEEVCERFNIKP